MLDAQRRVTASWLSRLIISLTLLVWSALALLVLWLLSHVVTTLIIFVLATLIAYALYPLVQVLQRWMPRPIAIGIVYSVVFLGICALVYVLIRAIIDQVDSLITLINDARQTGPNNKLQPLVSALEQLGVTSDQVSSSFNQIAGQLRSTVSSLLQVAKGIFTALLNVLLIATLSVYALLDGPRLHKWLRHRTPASQRSLIMFLQRTFTNVVGGYVRGQIVLSLILSSLTCGAMFLIGIPYALLLGVVAFVLSFIPTIGALTTGAVCLLLALTQGWVAVVFTILFLIGNQILETNILGPRIVGSAVGLRPFVSILAFIAGGELFGLIGAVLAAPLAGLLQTFISASWQAWREQHPEQFTDEAKKELVVE